MSKARTIPSLREAAPRHRTRIFIARGEDIRAVHVTPRQLKLGAAILAAFSALYFGSTLYLVLRDATPGPASRASHVQESYEDRISALRTEIDTLRSAGAIDRATIDQKVDAILAQQKSLDARQAMLNSLADAARRAGFDIATPAPATTAEVARPTVSEAAMPAAPSAPRFNDLGLRSELLPGDRHAAADQLGPIGQQLDAMANRQDAVVDGLAGHVAQRAQKIALALRRIGRSVPAAPDEDVGGPFVPIPAGSEDAAFQASVGTLSQELSRLAELRRIALTLPLRQPLPEAIVTSPFGPRLDPFLGRPAMHTGIDFRAPEGSPARSVAAGTVIAAEYNNGYGNMVDVDHGNGIVTRYGHLSAITVHTGQKVLAGSEIGRIGETGRATGPHLHYEIRVDGQPIDPERYLRAGKEIAALL